MESAKSIKRLIRFAFFLVLFSSQEKLTYPQSKPNQVSEIRVVEFVPPVEVSPAGSTIWQAAATNEVLRAGDRVRTRERARLVLRMSDQSLVRFPELSEFQIQPTPAAKTRTGLNLFSGMLYFFHRDKPVEVQFNTRTASAAVRGTEFNLAVDENGRTILTLVDGEVELSNDQGPLVLVSGGQGIAEPAKRPTKTALLDTINVIQWCLYYPGVLDIDELKLTGAEQQTLSESLMVYRNGDLLQALAKYPANRQPASAAEKVYFGALLLAVGQVERTEVLFKTLA